MLVTNVERLPDRVKRELIRGENARAEFDIHQQRRLKEASDLLETRHVEGLGQKVMLIHPDLAWRLRVKYGMSCLHDPDFRRSLLRKNPFLRVKSVPQKTVIRVDGLRKEEGGRRKAEGRARNSERLDSQLSTNNSQLPRQSERDAGNYGAQGDPAPPSAEVRHPRQKVFGHETSAGVSLDLPSPHVTRHMSHVTSSL